MTGKFANVKIKGIISVVPKRIEENMYYMDLIGEKRLKKQIRITGVKRRHIPEENQKTSDLCTEAAKALIEKLGWGLDSVKYLILVTQVPDFKYPSTALFIQKRLRIGNECLAFDVNLGCSGYTAGLQIISALVENSGGRGILMTGDVEYRTPEQQAREDYVNQVNDDILFGMAGTATAIEYECGQEMSYMQHSDGNGYDVIIRTDEYTRMDGSKVFNFVMNEVAESVLSFNKYFKLGKDDIDYYVFHQAQKLILDSLGDICEIENDKMLSSLENYGNTSSSSIPVTLCANYETIRNQGKVKIHLCGFGIGLAWGSIYVEIDTKDIYPIIESDNYYNKELDMNHNSEIH